MDLRGANPLSILFRVAETGSQELICRVLVLIRYGYNCVIYGWDPTCMMGHEWIRNMNVHSLPHGHHQPFYNVLVEDGSCRYAAQGE